MLKKILFIGGTILILMSIGLAIYYWTYPVELPNNNTQLPTPTTITTAIPQPGREVAIFSVPQGASISVDGVDIGTTPVKYTFPILKSYHLQAQKQGYIPLVADYTPNDTTLRLQLVPDSVATSSPTFFPTTYTFSSSPHPSPTSSLLPGTIVPFPTRPYIRILTQPKYNYVYTTQPSPSPTSSENTPTPTPRTATPLPSVSANPAHPSDQQIEQYNDLIADYNGIHDFPPGDAIGEGTADKESIVIDTQWFYPAHLRDFVAFPIHFLNQTTTSCTLHVLGSQGEKVIGTLLGKEDLIFSAENGTNETMRFWCSERPQLTVDVDIFS